MNPYPPPPSPHYPSAQGYGAPDQVNQGYGSPNDLNLNQMNLNSGNNNHHHYPPPGGSSGSFHLGHHQLHRPHLHDLKEQILHHQQGPTQVVCGPLLRYIDTDYQARVWRGSCLIVSNETRAPPLRVELKSAQSGRSQVLECHAERLDSFRHQYHFWRYELNLPLTTQQQHVVYSVPSTGANYDFHLPAIQESMRFMFYSCNGFSDIPQDIKDKFGGLDHPLWQDVLDRHQVMPFHVLIGGGDQLYQDRIIKEDFMQPWNEEKDPKKRLAMTLPPQMVDGMERFYFDNYVENFG